MDILSTVGAYLGVAGNEIANIDDNRTGADDFAAAILLYGSDVIASVGSGMDLPEFPDELKTGVSDKITGPAKITLRIASSMLMLAQTQVSGKAGIALRYIAQVVRNLISGTLPPVPPRPIVS